MVIILYIINYQNEHKLRKATNETDTNPNSKRSSRQYRKSP
jgi:hypothetical protein